jgi:hypothetical protein
MPGGKVERLSLARLDRLERRLAAIESRLDQTDDVLTRLVRIVAIVHRRLADPTRPQARVDRLSRALTTGRTADIRRLRTLERRLALIERRLG